MKSTHKIPSHRPRHGLLSHELRSEWVSERANEQSAEAQRAVRSKQMGEQCERTSKQRCKWPSTQCVDSICFLPNVERGIWKCWSQRKESTHPVFRDQRGGILRHKLTKICAHACSLFVVCLFFLTACSLIICFISYLLSFFSVFYLVILSFLMKPALYGIMKWS